MIIQRFDYTMEELQNIGDVIKEITLQKLVDEQIITIEQLKDFTATHTIILKKRTKISAALNRLFKFEEKDKENIYSVHLAKIEDIRDK